VATTGQLDKRMLHWQPATCCIFSCSLLSVIWRIKYYYYYSWQVTARKISNIGRLLLMLHRLQWRKSRAVCAVQRPGWLHELKARAMS